MTDSLNLVWKVIPPSFIKPNGNRKLYDFTEFLITLRLNLKNCGLGYVFSDTVCESVITNPIHKWLKILCVTLKFLIRWPSREEVQKFLPECFRGKFQRVMVITDSIEVFIEQATNFLTRFQTQSNYINLITQWNTWLELHHKEPSHSFLKRGRMCFR